MPSDRKDQGTNNPKGGNKPEQRVKDLPQKDAKQTDQVKGGAMPNRKFET